MSKNDNKRKNDSNDSNDSNENNPTKKKTSQILEYKLITSIPTMIEGYLS